MLYNIQVLQILQSSDRRWPKRSTTTMHSLGKVRNLLLIVCLLAPGAVWADWELDNTASMIKFVSIKNNSVGELHSFGSLEGSIAVDGKSQVTILLNSVETLIEIRNERMRELLFETVRFPVARATAQVDPALLTKANGGDVTQADLPITLKLHGQENELTIPVSIAVESDGSLHVFTTQPVLISATDFGLEGGVEALRKIAGLKAISNVVPVSMELRFVRTK
jgi:polyisoprenoid-binding protein YceI